LSNGINNLIIPGDTLQYNSKYEYLYNEYTAIYRIKSDCLIIEDALIKNRKKIIKFNKVDFFTKNIPTASEAVPGEMCDVLYLVFNKIFYKKYIPILVPPLMTEDVVKRLSASLRFYFKDEVDKK
jgi:hypothetical protein